MHLKNEIKALILVGGYGSRLRPLTYTTPKPLIEFVGVPILERQISALVEAGVKEIILAMNYKYSLIIEKIKPLENQFNIKIIFSLENEPLGTAGPISFAKKYLQNNLFFVLNSDIICEYPFLNMIEEFSNINAIGTICVTSVEDPSKFGVIKINTKNFIDQFIEKPQVFISNLINAGIYLFRPKIFDYLPNGPSSIENDVFPKLALLNELHSIKLNSFWADIGTPSGYLNGQMQYLNSTKNFFVGKNTIIGKNCILINCVIFNNCIIGNNVVIRNSLIGNGCEIGDNVVIDDFSILGDETKLRSGILKDNVVADEFSVFGDGSELSGEK